MDTFEKMMENEATPKKDDFVEMVNFIMTNRNDKSAIEDELSFFVESWYVSITPGAITMPQRILKRLCGRRSGKRLSKSSTTL